MRWDKGAKSVPKDDGNVLVYSGQTSHRRTMTTNGYRARFLVIYFGYSVNE
jgi:hypothetical protein